VAEHAGQWRDRGAASGSTPGLPDGDAVDRSAGHFLPGFAKGGRWDSRAPSAELAIALESASGPAWRCLSASRDEMFGLLRQWQVLEAWAAAGKLGILRTLIREDDQPLPGGGYHADLPEGWTKSLTHEVAAALSVPAVSAEPMMWLAWNLEGRLPGVGELLKTGALTYGKAKAVDDALQALTDEDAAVAEAMILADLPGKTYGQATRLAVQAAITVDPESATRRREDAERSKSRVQLIREDSGAAGLLGRDMPTDQTLAAHANVCARAQEYKGSGAFGGDVRMDQYRVAAYLDLLNGVTADVRIALGILPGACPPGGDEGGSCRAAYGPGAPPDDDGAGEARDDSGEGRGSEGRGDGEGNGQDDGSPDRGGKGPGDRDGGGEGGHAAHGDGGPRGGSDSGGRRDDARPGHAGPTDIFGGGSRGKPSTGEAAGPPSRPTDLVIPLATLLGLAERPGEGHGLGPLDPVLCRALARAAVGNPHTSLCVTVTDPDGIAVGHGCARPSRRGRLSDAASHGGPGGLVPAIGPGEPGRAAGPGSGIGLVTLPARVNLTIGAARLAEMTEGAGPPGPGAWTLRRDGGDGSPDGYGSWTLTRPDGGKFTIELRPVPTFECDHRYESNSYQPNDLLRHLVQVRDGDCTFPTCSRHAKESDFEHALPYDKGGRTCACNAGARSRACHRVKQSPGWNVTQPRPGWHQWTTPTGRAYLQGPKRYPA
jgi:hypothetical protein